MSLRRTHESATVERQRSDDIIRRILTSESAEWPTTSGDGFEEAFLRRADYHGTACLLHEKMSHMESCPTTIRHHVRERAIASAMWELRHQRLLADVHAVLRQMNVQPLLFKGTALAYGLYEAPWLRMRGDTDMLIAWHDRRRVHDALRDCGFEQQSAISGDFIAYQASYTLTAPDKGQHTIDLHWRINNSELLSRLFTYEEFIGAAVDLPALCDGAKCASPAHALILACMHRKTHLHNPYYVDNIPYLGADRLIWNYDIHLLANLLSPAQWNEVVHLAKVKGLSGVLYDGIRAAGHDLRTACPKFVFDALAEAPAGEQPAIYFRSSRLRQLWMDFSELEGLSNKMKFLRELAFPPAAYIRDRFQSAHLKWLPWLYARRGLGGIAKWFGPHRHAS
jgi:Uncharacterised nucleotidyltransferase